MVMVHTVCAGCGREIDIEIDIEDFDDDDQERLRRGETVEIEDEYCLSCQAGIDWDVTRDWARR